MCISNPATIHVHIHAGYINSLDRTITIFPYPNSRTSFQYINLQVISHCNYELHSFVTINMRAFKITTKLESLL